MKKYVRRVMVLYLRPANVPLGQIPKPVCLASIETTSADELMAECLKGLNLLSDVDKRCGTIAISWGAIQHDASSVQGHMSASHWSVSNGGTLDDFLRGAVEGFLSKRLATAA